MRIPHNCFTLSATTVGCIVLGLLSSADAAKCTIKQTVGKVQLRRGASTVWNDARLRMPLRETDAVRTFMESEAVLEIDDGSTIKVGENTTMELASLKGNDESRATGVKIMNGTILANVKKIVSSTSSFDFETPTATAAIRGTVLGLEVTGELTRVKVYEGRVLVTPSGAKKGIELQKDQQGVVKKGSGRVAIEKLDRKDPSALSPAGADSVRSSPPDSAAVDSTSGEADSTAGTPGAAADSARSHVSLVLSSPAEGSFVQPLAQVQVTGSIKPADIPVTVIVNGQTVSPGSDGTFRVSLKAPESGTMEIAVQAEWQGGSSSLNRRIAVTDAMLNFTVTVPRDGQEFSKPVLPVSGMVTPGAEVSAFSVKIPVTSGGAFNGQVPIPNEAGPVTLEFEAYLNGTTQKIVRRVVYKPEYRFILLSPSERQTITATNFIVRGEVLPADAEVSVMGRRLAVTDGGQFSGAVTIPDEEGEVILEFEVVAGGISRTEKRRIFYKKPPDTFRPQLSASVAKGCWNITVFDRTPEEEITLWYEVDGNKDSRSLRPNETACIPLENGIHSYRVFAEDRAKNLSATEALQNHHYLANTTWLIRVRRPQGNVTLDIPPGSPAGELPFYTVEFTVENLPQDEMRLIREVIVTNKTSGKSVALRTFTDNYLEADVELIRRRVNKIQIDVRDINNVVKSQIFTIDAR